MMNVVFPTSHGPWLTGGLRLLSLAALLMAFTPQAWSQTSVGPTTVSDPEISTAVLRAQLRPMPQAELKVELDGWLALLRNKAEEIRDVEVRLVTAETHELDALSQRLVTLQAQRSRLVERVYNVMNAYAAKGGDVEAAKKYVSSVWSLDRSGRRGVWPIFKAWVTSPEGGGRAVKRSLSFLFWVVVTLLLGRLVTKVVSRAAGRIPGVSQLLRSFLANASRAAVYVTGGVIALSHLGVNAAPLAAALGATGFIVGFALKDTLGNYASGVMILIYRPYDIGHTVTAGGVSGVIESMNLVATVFRTADRQKVIVPNSKIWSGTITNASAKDPAR
jgi:small conductance mechanosensitive channel